MPHKPPAPSQYLEIARQEGAILIRVVGLGDMHLAPTMNDFFKQELREGFAHVAIDLQSCTGMDSTFMGTLAGMASRIAEQKGWICLINVSAEHRRLLEMIGVWNLLPVREQFPIKPVLTERLHPVTDTHKRIEVIHKAHQHLVDVDSKNQERFGAFLRALEQEMATQIRDTSDPDEANADTRPLPPPRSPDAPSLGMKDSDIIRFDDEESRGF